uniref:hypothetical protein n=1 Tax=Lactobacillus kefiranofaciens TaxID=267818 RepID=UPI000556F8C1
LENQIKHFRPKLKIESKNNPSLKTGVKLFNKHTAGKLNAHNADIEVLCLDTFLNSFKDEKNEFSNYIRRLGIKGTYIYKDILALCQTPNQIANEITSIDILNRKNSLRIKEILSQGLSSKLIANFDDSIFESVVKRGSDFFDPNGKGKFRVFSIYVIDKEGSIKETQKLVIFLIDPCHLVCPIADKARNLTKSQNRHKIFENQKDCNDSLSDVFYSKFVDSNSIKFISLQAFLKNNISD